MDTKKGVKEQTFVCLCLLSLRAPLLNKINLLISEKCTQMRENRW